MNAIRGMMHLSLRGYRSSRGSTSARRPKPPRETNFIQPGMPVENFNSLEDELNDVDDLEAYEGDFKSVKEYNTIIERETEVKKAKLMTQIVKRKYFKSDEPAMLTWGEKEQIRLLHKQDPEQWTADKLSDSFPASREAILKVLRSKWSVKSVKVVQKYEQTVKENWALFKAGKLKVDPQLEAHLGKFKNREIETTDPETIAKNIVKPRPVFPKPQSTLFSGIIQGYLDVHPASRDEEDDEIPVKKSSKKKSFAQIISDESSKKRESKESATTTKLATEAEFSPNKTLTFDQFLEKHVEGVREENMTPVDRVIVDEVKQKNTEAYKNQSMVFESASAVAPWKFEDKKDIKRTDDPESTVAFSESERTSEARIVPKNQNNELAVQAEKSVQPDLANILEGSLETGIIARHKTGTALLDDYPDYIKIPPKKWKRGVTYRVQDRYYDDDGELLYRVPGLKT